MTIDEAIRHCEEVAERYETRAKIIDRRKLGFALENPTACHECAADHRQLAEWLMELKELKNSVGAVKLKDMKEALELIREYKSENIAQKKMIAEYKRLLKAAVEDFDEIHSYLSEPYSHICEKRWRYADEALKLIES